MSPTIDLDADIFEYLKSQAEPFVDTPSSVLRRLLDLNGAAHHNGDEGVALTSEPRPGPRQKQVTTPRPAKSTPHKSVGRTRAASGTILPEQDYEAPLLRALVDVGGEAPYREVVEAVGRELQDKLMPADLETLASGSVRWHSRLQFVRLRLIERGDMDREAPRGVWRISEAGRGTLNGGAA